MASLSRVSGQTSPTEVLIIGGGTMGLAIAVELAFQGIKSTILTRNLEEAALYAAAGMLAPQAEQLPPGPMLELCLASRRLYPDWIGKLEQLTGLDAGYWPCGILAPVYEGDARGEAIDQRQENTEQEKSHLNPSRLAHWLTPAQVPTHQPGLAAKIRGAWWYPADGQVDNRALGQVLLGAAAALGITIQTETTVTEFLASHNKITGIATTAGVWQADQYVLASGAWSQALLPIPVVPRKGQMLSLRLPPDQPRPLDHVIFAPDVYLVPRQQSRIVIGATSEDAEFRPGNTPQGINTLLTAALALCPALAESILEELWWGFRPVTPDELPILGQGAWENLWLATGHYRNGILLAPITAQLLTKSILNGAPDASLQPFNYCRF